jgi:putative (di)nucleoside polyphosphate hydrolase
MLFNHVGRVLVARRGDRSEDAWQMPQGGIDAGESPRAAALRELREEIGTDRAEIVAESRDWLSYDLPPELVGKAWKGRYRGQRQKWFLMRFTGQDDDIDLAAHDAEFDAWTWVPPESIVRLIVGFKLAVYTKVVAEFAPRIHALADSGNVQETA